MSLIADASLPVRSGLTHAVYRPRADMPTERRLEECLAHCVLCHLQWRRLDAPAGWFRSEFHRLFGEGIDAAPRFSSGLIDHGHLCKTGDDKLPGLVELLVANRRHMLDH